VQFKFLKFNIISRSAVSAAFSFRRYGRRRSFRGAVGSNLQK